MNTPENATPHRLASARVVVGVDGSAGSDDALRWAAHAASRRRRGLHLLHGLDLAATRAKLARHDVLTGPIIEMSFQRGRKVVDDAYRLALQVDPELSVTTEVSDAKAAEVLIQASSAAHLVVLGATGNAGTFAHLGSTLLAVTSHGHGSVVVVRGNGSGQVHERTGAVVVGADATTAGDAAIAAAFAEASDRGAELIVVHAWSDWNFYGFAGRADLGLVESEIENSEDALLAERLAGWQEKYPDVRVTRLVSSGGPVRPLMELSGTAQLLVVGTRGHGAFTGLLLGSTSNFLVQHAHCPVMVTHQE
ncbi:universal stress protein [Nocardia vulneris]|uniref:Universal stress protein n=1 Tax=Nocardia vulneris TaxID=1141657 RepID=A0ABR4ZB38_9NOCA|nr:universal stress protein [Nocardia vulneris]KIA62501.1 universal stress protein [Nocardia vulneris]